MHTQRSNIVYSGEEIFKGNKRLASILDAEGVMASGWTHQQIFRGLCIHTAMCIYVHVYICDGTCMYVCMYVGNTERDKNIALSKLNQMLKTCLDKIKSSAHHWPFDYPVDEAQVCIDMLIHIYVCMYGLCASICICMCMRICMRMCAYMYCLCWLCDCRPQVIMMQSRTQSICKLFVLGSKMATIIETRKCSLPSYY